MCSINSVNFKRFMMGISIFFKPLCNEAITPLDKGRNTVRTSSHKDKTLSAFSFWFSVSA